MSNPRRGRKHKRHFHRQTLPGAPPGVVDVDPNAASPVITLMAYGPGPVVEKKLTNVNQINEYVGQYKSVWVNVSGLGDKETIRKLGEMFDLHPLALEDVVHVHQRPKLEQYPGHLFIVARMVTFQERLDTEQVSIFLGSNFVLTFLEDPGDSFDPVRRRLRSGDTRLLASGPGYLAYSLLDALIDAYFPVVEDLGDRMETLEDEVFVPAGVNNTVARIHAIKRDLRSLRRMIWPLREVLGTLGREMTTFIDEPTRLYLRDCYDHTVQIIDLVEMYRELGADLTDLYLSSQSHRLNDVMRVLTIIATVFMPLGFIVGIYGMNFNTEAGPLNMPELNWPYGYAFVWSVIIVVTTVMLVFFYRKGWLKSFASATPTPAPTVLGHSADEPPEVPHHGG